MPIIGQVGRKSKGARILNYSIHLILILGAITMIYPFMLMISSSFKSQLDSKEFSIIPQYFYKEESLFKKYIESRLNEESNRLYDQYQNAYPAFDYVSTPDLTSNRLLQEWDLFLRTSINKQTIYDYYVSEQYGRGIYPYNQRVFRNLMKSRYNNQITSLNTDMDSHFPSWDEVMIEEKEILSRNFSGSEEPIRKIYERFKLQLPISQRDYINLDGNYIANELAPRYQNDLRILNDSLKTAFVSWDEIKLTREVPDNALRESWLHYVRSLLNIHHIILKKEALPDYQDYLRNKYQDIKLLNQTYKTHYGKFNEIIIPERLAHSGAFVEDLSFYVESKAKAEHLQIKSVDFDFREYLYKKYHTIENFTKSLTPGYTEFNQISLPLNSPSNNLNLLADWTEFVKTKLDLKKINILPTAQNDYLSYLSKRFKGQNDSLDLNKYNKTMDKDYTQDIDIYPDLRCPVNIKQKAVWQDFYYHKVQSRDIALVNIGSHEHTLWLNYLKSKYHDINNLNRQYRLIPNIKGIDGNKQSAFDKIILKHQDIDYFYFKQNKAQILKEFLVRNYSMVLDLMLYNGKAITNTIWYCFLSILVAILVNPLAAYALSRFKPRFTYQVLMIFMLTMAFPAMVMGIPNFILLKKMSLLNTFWALILPAAADGYFIFLLKGFFDSLPKEMIESATLDGASEWRLFWQFIMSLSKPILAVIALGAFNGAYRNFMFAFIVCQNQDMWTLMVHIYQLMQRSSAGVGYASLVIAAIPTLLVYVFFQNIIIKAIVVPTEK